MNDQFPAPLAVVVACPELVERVAVVVAKEPVTDALGDVVPVNETLVVANTAFSAGERIAKGRTTVAGTVDVDAVDVEIDEDV